MYSILQISQNCVKILPDSNHAYQNSDIAARGRGGRPGAKQAGAPNLAISDSTDA